MIASILLSLTSPLPPACSPAAEALGPQPAAALVRPRADEEYTAKLAEAGNDPAKLWELHLWCKETSRNSESRETLKKLLELAPDHEDAHKALGHHNYDGQWFETYTALAKYKRAEEQRMREQGLARYKDDWVKIEDVPYLRMSWVKGDDGQWRSPHEIARREQAEKYRADGWVQKDMLWISPEEAPNLEKGLFKCGEEWLAEEEANAFHSQIGQWWRMHQQHFIVNSTCQRHTADWARYFADSTFNDLVRLYGVVPGAPIEVTVLNSVGQYNAMAGGDQTQGIQGVEASGWSSCHYAFFGELFVDGSVQPFEYRGQGVGFWDVNDPNLADFGPMSVRHAAGLSFAEVIDPSLDTVSRFIENPSGAPSTAAFWSEKKIPLWLRYGGASYVERYMADERAEEGQTWAARDWAIDNLRRAGGLLPFERVFAFALDPNDPNGSARLISQAGLYTSFILDGSCKPVADAHAKLKSLLRGNGAVAEAATELQQALVANAPALMEYCGLEMAAEPAAAKEAASPTAAGAPDTPTQEGGDGAAEGSGGR